MTSDSELTLSGDVPGLLRRGSPVVLVVPHPSLEGTDQAYMAWVAERGRPPGSRRAVVLAVDGGGRVLIATGAAVMWAWLTDVALDLTDATGRAHAAWWLASAVMPQAAAPIAWLWCMGDGRWSLRSGGDWVTFRAPGSPEPSERRPEVPALASLDPNDRHRLSDGSWRVNAEALRLVCLHVAGRAP